MHRIRGYLLSVTASEVLIGFHRADTPEHRLRREAFVEAVFDMLPVLPFDLQVARVHAQIWAQLSSAGWMIGAHDQIIAATALTATPFSRTTSASSSGCRGLSQTTQLVMKLRLQKMLALASLSELKMRLALKNETTEP